VRSGADAIAAATAAGGWAWSAGDLVSLLATGALSGPAALGLSAGNAAAGAAAAAALPPSPAPTPAALLVHGAEDVALAVDLWAFRTAGTDEPFAGAARGAPLALGETAVGAASAPGSSRGGWWLPRLNEAVGAAGASASPSPAPGAPSGIELGLESISGNSSSGAAGVAVTWVFTGALSAAAADNADGGAGAAPHAFTRISRGPLLLLPAGTLRPG
jgi:hypothetical protein